MKTTLAGILGEPSTWHSQQVQAAFAHHGIIPRFFHTRHMQARLSGEGMVFHQDVCLDDLDLLLVRDVPGGSLEQVIYRMDALHQLENNGVRIINRPGAIEKMVDKYYTLSLLAQAGLRVPATIVTEDPSEALQAFHQLGGDVVLKPLFGSRGAGMVRLTEEDTANRTFRALELGHYVYYLQQFIPHNNCDIRILTIGDRCVAAMQRHASGWKTNISQGATPQSITPTDAMQEISLRAARAVEADYCGIDLLPAEDGSLYLIEANSMPAWNGLQSVTSTNLAALLVEYCLARV